MKTKYTWDYLNSLITKYFRTYECFVDTFEDDKMLAISYTTFRQQKRRETKKYLKVYIDYILEEFEKPLSRLIDIFLETFSELMNNSLNGEYIEIKNNGSDFTVYKSWSSDLNTNICIKNKIILFLENIMFNELFKELFNNDENLLKIINTIISDFIHSKIKLLNYIKFIFNKNSINIEIRFNEVTISLPIKFDFFINLLKPVDKLETTKLIT